MIRIQQISVLIIFILLIQISFQLIDNCTTEVADECTQCDIGYHGLKDTGATDIYPTSNCLKDIDNCQAGDNNHDNQFCINCEANFHLSTNKKKCYANIDNCITHTDAICTDCNTDFHIENAGANCFADVTNCDTYNNGVCQGCIDTYLVFVGACYLEIVNCADQYENGCANCGAGSHKNAEPPTICHLDIPFCTTHYEDDINKCETCNDNAPKSDDETICYGPITNCVNGQQDLGTCNECESNFHLNAEKTSCHGDINNCSTYTTEDADLCSACSGEFVLDQVDKTVCHAAITGCTVQVDDTCTTCDETQYHSDQNNNTRCIENIEHCTTYNAINQELCDACEDDYNINDDNDVCYGVIQNCKVQDQETCTECSEGYHENQLSQLCHLDVVGCQTYDEAACTACTDAGQHPAVVAGSNGVTACFANIENCETYETSNNYHCKTCLDNFYLSLNKKSCLTFVANCKIYGVENCSQCKSNYHYDSTNLSCVLDVENCDTYATDDAQTCENCLQGFELDDTKNCQVSCGVNLCTTCSDDFLCQNCESGYVISDNKRVCQKQCASNAEITNCSSCSTDSCSKCDDGFFENKNGSCSKCTEISSGCIECSQFSSSCNKCDSGYKLFEGSCRTCEYAFDGTNHVGCENCTISGSEFECTACKTPYYFKDGDTCYSCNTNSGQLRYCEQCQDANTCLQCRTGYYLSRYDALEKPGKCVVCPENVIQCELNNLGDSVVVLECVQSYYLFENECLVCEESCLNCTERTKSDCTECKNGYMMYKGLCISNLPVAENEGDAAFDPSTDITTMQTLFGYSTIQAKLLGGGEKTFNFDSTTSSGKHFCNSNILADNTCLNEGVCKDNFCECEEGFYGNYCQFSKDSQAQIQEQAKLVLTILKKFVDDTNLDFTDQISLDYINNIILVVADQSQFFGQEQFESTSLQISSTFLKYKQNWSLLNLEKFLQISLELIKGVTHNIIMEEDEISVLKKFEFGYQLYEITQDQLYKNVIRENKSEQEISFDHIKGFIEKQDISDSEQFKQYKKNLQNSLRFRFLEPEFEGTTMKCNTDKIDEADVTISNEDFEKIRDLFYEQRVGTNNDMTVIQLTNYEDKFESSIELQTATVQFTPYDSNKLPISVEQKEIDIYIRIPKKNMRSGEYESITQYNCYNWSNTKKTWVDVDIVQEDTLNCGYYVICRARSFGNYGAGQKEKDSITENLDDGNDAVIMGKYLVKQPGFIINIILLVLLLVAGCLVSKYYRTEPEKQTRRKIHIPELQRQYQEKRDRDHMNFQNNEQNKQNGQSYIPNSTDRFGIGTTDIQMTESQFVPNNNDFSNNNPYMQSQQQQNFKQISMHPQQQQNVSNNNPNFSQSQSPYNPMFTNNNLQQSQNIYADNYDPYTQNQGNPMDTRMSQSIPPQQQQQGATQVIEERTINPWMIFHVYSIYHTPQIGLRYMKLSLLFSSLQFYCLMNCIFFGYNNPQTGYAILFILLSMIFTWLFNYIWGFISTIFRTDDYGSKKIHPVYWGLYFVLFIGLTVGSMVASYKEHPDAQELMVIGFFICIIVDMCILDVFITYVFKEIHDESQKGFIRSIRIIKFKGYYEDD